ncbi:hypothetical protein DT075_21905 [Bacillus licheniformis]|nr:hypothetical protein DT075_21905 [Bacillus licheniformis]
MDDHNHTKELKPTVENLSKAIAVLFPGIIADVDYIYYGLAGIILLAALYYFIALPKLSAESAEIDVQAALKRQKNTKAKMNSVL